MEKHTPLYFEHLELNAKMVDFAGFLMPIQYPEGIIKEHLAVRNQAGIFDVSHMGEIKVSGEGAYEYLSHLVSSDLSKLKVGKIKYGLLCNEKGGTVDDLLAYQTGEKEYLLVVNASNKDKDYAWLKNHSFETVSIEDLSDEYSLIALQGPQSQEILRHITEDIPLKKYTFVQGKLLEDTKCLISRTGYTGEDGFELYLDNDSATKVWKKLLELGAVPCGLGARDTLRIEAAMSLYGHELTEERTPFDAGLGFFIDKNKEFIGKSEMNVNTDYKLIGFEIIGKGIAREGSEIIVNDAIVGYVSSGTFSPSLEKGIGMAFIKKDQEIEDSFTINVRGRKLTAKRTEMPFIRKKK